MPIHLQLTTPTHIITPPDPFLAYRIYEATPGHTPGHTKGHTYVTDVPISAVFQHEWVTEDVMQVQERPPQQAPPHRKQKPPRRHRRERRESREPRESTEPIRSLPLSRRRSSRHSSLRTRSRRRRTQREEAREDAQEDANAVWNDGRDEMLSAITTTATVSPSPSPLPSPRSTSPPTSPRSTTSPPTSPSSSAILLQPSPHLTISVPTVSIIMTTYNCAKYIEHAIRSLQAQTLTNWELVVVDDRSTDDLTDTMLRELAQEDDRMVYLRNARNLGCYASKNIALDYVRGTWLTFHDADDYSMCERLEKQLHYCTVGDHNENASNLNTTNDPTDPNNPNNPKDAYDCCYATSLARKQKTWTWIPITMFLRTQTFHDRLGAFDTVRFGADSEIRERMTSLQMRVGVVDDYLYACPDRWIELNGRTTSLTGDQKHDPIREHYRNAYLRFHHHLRRTQPLAQRSPWLRYTFPPAPHLTQIGAMEARPFVVEGIVGDEVAERLLYPGVGDIRETVGVNEGK